jgi:hypothetical protein
MLQLCAWHPSSDFTIQEARFKKLQQELDQEKAKVQAKQQELDQLKEAAKERPLGKLGKMHRLEVLELNCAHKIAIVSLEGVHKLALAKLENKHELALSNAKNRYDADLERQKAELFANAKITQTSQEEQIESYATRLAERDAEIVQLRKAVTSANNRLLLRPYTQDSLRPDKRVLVQDVDHSPTKRNCVARHRSQTPRFESPRPPDFDEDMIDTPLGDKNGLVEHLLVDDDDDDNDDNYDDDDDEGDVEDFNDHSPAPRIQPPFPPIPASIQHLVRLKVKLPGAATLKTFADLSTEIQVALCGDIVQYGDDWYQKRTNKRASESTCNDGSKYKARPSELQKISPNEFACRRCAHDDHFCIRRRGTDAVLYPRCDSDRVGLAEDQVALFKADSATAKTLYPGKAESITLASSSSSSHEGGLVQCASSSRVYRLPSSFDVSEVVLGPASVLRLKLWSAVHF